jgi:integrase
MSLSDTAIRALKPKPIRYEKADQHGLFIEILPSGDKSWRYRYRLSGRREKVTIGPYPDVSLSEARERRQDFAKLIAKGDSPARAKQRQKLEGLKAKTVLEMGTLFRAEVIEKKYRRAVDAKRYLTRDIYPVLGHYLLAEVRPDDVMTVIERIRKRGSEQAARTARGILKRLYDYAITRRMVAFNPVSEIAPKAAGEPHSRERNLSPAELKQFLTRLDAMEDTKALKIALRLILLTLTRKGELTRAKRELIDLDALEWRIPTEHSKSKQPHIVYLSKQAARLFKELIGLSGDSEWLLPGRNPKRPISAHTLNVMLYRHKSFGLKDFVIHDLRRTASTLLHEAGFPSDVIEKALNHTIKGVRGVYNRAEYADQRREMLQFWGDYLDELTSSGKVIIGRFRRPAA